MREGSAGLSKEGGGVWSVLANTERWISDTIAKSNSNGPSTFARKEISYVCETTEEALMTVASIFRRVKEARELGESHSRAEESVLMDKGPNYKPSTFRQTQVVVIPWCEYFESFQNFETVIQAVTGARRSARDYVTDAHLLKLDMGEKRDRDWVIGVNLASLHPNYGEKSSEGNIDEMGKEKGEVDEKLKRYIELRTLARQSPYPTLVIEVKAVPPPDFGSNPPPTQQGGSDRKDDSNVTGGEDLNEDVKKLEILFGKSAAMPKTGNVEDNFYDSIGKVDGIEQVVVESPTITTQNWIVQNDPSYHQETSTFAKTDAKEVDTAYERIFTNIAMQGRSQRIQSSENVNIEKDKITSSDTIKSSVNRSYIIMPQFLSSSATSFEKFALQVTNIIGTIKGLEKHVSVNIFHPEHIDGMRQSPLPVFVIQWNGEGT